MKPESSIAAAITDRRLTSAGVERVIGGPGGVALGMHCFSGSPGIAEAAVRGGLDFIVIDCEHSINTDTEVAQCTRAVQASGADAWVRIARIDVGVGRLLDFGIDGIVLSRANEARLRELLGEALYAPAGRRGACPAVRAAGYAATEWTSFAARANERLWLVPLVEDRQGVKDVEALASCPQVRALFIGAFDLAAELGAATTDLREPPLAEVFDAIAAAAARHGKPLMASAGIDADAAYVAWLKARGARIFSTGADVQTVRSVAAQAQALRAS
jgi:2-keto-3-deoxy-L-rhamnonate aldolase RhmA